LKIPVLSEECDTRPARLIRKVKSLREDTQGIAAIEFALLVPVMFGLYFGVTIMSLTIAANRNVSHATSVTSDLTAQYDIIDQETIANIMTAAVAILGISKAEIDANRLSIEVSSYATPYAIDSVNMNLLNERSGIVVTRIAYQYQTIGRDNDTSTRNWTLDNISLEDEIVNIPRSPGSVPFGDGSVDGAGSRFTGCSVNTSLIVSC